MLLRPRASPYFDVISSSRCAPTRQAPICDVRSPSRSAGVNGNGSLTQAGTICQGFVAHLNPFFYMIDGFRYAWTGAADTDDLDDRQIVLRCCHEEGTFPLVLNAAIPAGGRRFSILP